MRILIPLLALALSALVIIAVATREPAVDPTDDATPESVAVNEDAVGEPAAGGASSDPTNDAISPGTEADASGLASAETSAEAATDDEPAEVSDEPPTVTAVDTTPATETGTDADAGASLRVRPAETVTDAAVGAVDPDDDYRLRAAFTAYGAGIKQLQLADYAQRITNGDRYTLLDALKDVPAGQSPSFYTLAARSVTIEGQTLALNDQAWQLDAESESVDGYTATFTLDIVDDSTGETIAELRRVWTLPKSSYELRLEQTFRNATDRPLDVRFDQYGVGDLLVDEGAYLGDRRLFATGYFRPETPPKTNIWVEDGMTFRSSLVGDDDPAIWPNRSLTAGSRLAWIASENRYFALIAHRPVPAAADGQTVATADVPELEALFPNVGVRVAGSADRQDVVTTLGTAVQTVAAGEMFDLSLQLFAGPRKGELFSEQPYDALGFEKLIRYELGCTWCTFQWLAHLLLGYLKLLHGLVFDWGVAIILLVVTVRLLLHPITKRAQTNMMKMSKQMASIQPEMQKLKEKYKDNPQKMNSEVMKLYREKGVNPAGFLGCLPMLLQTPIWIALYAMLYYAIELRHEPAFYGVFQAITGGGWNFLADLSVADHFIKFPGDGFKLNLIFVHPTFAAINILPLLMAVAFYFNMKFTTPPPQTDEQRQQQRIMKIMPFIFPIFLYSAPSGLTLYICASTAAGIFDSYLVRKHVREQEEAGTLFQKKEAKPGSLKWKLQQRMKLAAEMAQARMEEQQQTRKKVDNTAGNKAYKNRKKK